MSDEIFGRIERTELQKAIIVHIDFEQAQQQENYNEFIELVTSADVEIVRTFRRKKNNIDPKLFIGKGLCAEISQYVLDYSALQADELNAGNNTNYQKKTKIDVVIINYALTPAQERNLERELKCQVLDRVGLILDIFAQRAKTHEGKLQVELAQLQHMSTRLVRGWTHLERQKGGIGMRGPGEKQLESDRRLLAARMFNLNQRIDKIKNQRSVSRQYRKKNSLPIVAIIGYTNAGKSSLFNTLTDANVYEDDKLFATLDSTIRSIKIPGAGTAILSDTVGFIRHIPHELVASFRSTLEETLEADLLLHVIDATDVDFNNKLNDVFKVLQEINALHIPQLLTLNKIDELSKQSQQNINNLCMKQLQLCQSIYENINIQDVVQISVQKGINIKSLLDTIAVFFKGRLLEINIEIDSSEGKLRSSIFSLGKVIKESINADNKLVLKLAITTSELEKLQLNKSVKILK